MQELDEYKRQYFNKNTIYKRLFPPCKCELCDNKDENDDYKESNNNNNKPRLKASSSFGGNNHQLSRYKTPYNLYGSRQKSLLVQQKSFGIICLNNNPGTLKSGSKSYGAPDNLSKAKSVNNNNYTPYGAFMNDVENDLPQLSHLASNCAKEQTVPLVEVMGIGMKNNRYNLMHTLNDINSRMIYEKQFNPMNTLREKMHTKSLPTEIMLNGGTIFEEKEVTSPASTGDMINKRNTFHQASNSKSSYTSRILGRSGSISSQSSYDGNNNSDTATTPSFSSQMSYEATAPILNVREFAKIKSLHSALRTCMLYMLYLYILYVLYYTILHKSNVIRYTLFFFLCCWCFRSFKIGKTVRFQSKIYDT